MCSAENRIEIFYMLINGFEKLLFAYSQKPIRCRVVWINDYIISMQQLIYVELREKKKRYYSIAFPVYIHIQFFRASFIIRADFASIL